LPAGMGLELFDVTAVDEFVVGYASGDEAGIRLLMILEGEHELVAIPDVANTAGIGGGIHARAPGCAIGHELGTAVATGDVFVFFGRKRGGFFDADDVVFEAEISIDVVFILEMADDHAGTVGEGENAFGRGEGVLHLAENLVAQIAQGFKVGFADFAEHEGFEAGHALAIVEPNLGDEPMRFTAAASAAVADFGGAIGQITEAGSGAGGELSFLKEATGGDETFGLVAGATEGEGEGVVVFEAGVHREVES